MKSSDMPRKRFELWSQIRQYQWRVEQARHRVSNWLEHVRNPYVAFSSGKDSTCVLALVKEQMPEVPAVYFDADCSFPESAKLVDRVGAIRFETDEPFLDTLARFGFDAGDDLDRATMKSTVWNPIKRLIEQYKFDGVAYGLRSEENPKTSGRLARMRGPVFQYKRDGLWACQPIFDWTYNDVWAFVVSNGLYYCGTYDRMWDMPEEDQRISYWAGE